MIELLRLGREQGWEPLRVAIEATLGMGSSDAAAVRHLLRGAIQRERLSLAGAELQCLPPERCEGGAFAAELAAESCNVARPLAGGFLPSLKACGIGLRF